MREWTGFSARADGPDDSRTPPDARSGLIDNLYRLGVRSGDILLVHSSLRRLGFVVGGAATVVQALLAAVGPDGTVVVPTFTANNSDPSRWALTRGQAVPQECWPAIREQLPPFDPTVTPSERMGAISEMIRTWPGAVRSQHPQTSFAAVGADASALMADHPLDCHHGPASPLGRLAESGAEVLLLGVSFAVCSGFHLAEYEVPNPPQRDYECVISRQGRRTWYRYRDVLLDDRQFAALGTALENSSTGALIRCGPVGDTCAKLVALQKCVEFARAWLSVAAQRPNPPGRCLRGAVGQE